MRKYIRIIVVGCNGIHSPPIIFLPFSVNILFDIHTYTKNILSFLYPQG